MKRLASVVIASFLFAVPAGPAHATQSWGSANQIVFASSREPAGIYVMKSNGSQQSKVTDADAFEDGAAWSPDADRILYTSIAGGDVDIYMTKPNGNGRKNLSKNNDFDYGPAWSPDGEEFVFTSDRDGQIDLYRMNVASGDVERITERGDLSSLPASYSPNGKLIAFAATGVSGDRDIFTIRADGSNQRNLTKTASSESAPAWSPNGQRIAAVREGEVALVRSNNGDVRGLDIPGSGPSWSPSGEFLSFSAFDGADGEIFRIRPDGSGIKNLTDNSVSDFLFD